MLYLKCPITTKTASSVFQNVDGVACETPEGMAFPLKTFEDVDTFE
jgi:hypothetical protein